MLLEKAKSATSEDSIVSTDGYRLPKLLQAWWNALGQRLRDQSPFAVDLTQESRDGVFIADHRWHFLQVNPGFTKITGFGVDDLQSGSSAFERFFDHSTADWAFCERELETRGFWRGELTCRRKSGEALSYYVIIQRHSLLPYYLGYVFELSDALVVKMRPSTTRLRDGLTGLYTLPFLIDRLDHSVALSRRSCKLSALLFITLNDFSSFTELAGYDEADAFLGLVAARLTNCVRATDIVTRVDGDEFVVLLEHLSDDPVEVAQSTEVIGRKLLTRLAEPYPIAGGEHHCTTSIGVILFGLSNEQPNDLLRRGQSAMHQARQRGRNLIHFYDADLQKMLTEKLTLLRDMRRGLKLDEFRLYYQPLVDVVGSVIDAEALIRWEHPSRGLLQPGMFIPIAEEAGLIAGLGLWVLGEACRQLVVWSQDPRFDHISIAVNVSAHQFAQPRFVDDVLATLERTQANPHRLKLEITESVFVKDVAAMIDTITRLKAVGIQFSLDDFGTGYSSLSYLNTLPIDYLKLDQSFVRALHSDDTAQITKTILSIGRSLNLHVIAEGVENESQLAFLTLHDVSTFQGFLFSPAKPADQFEDFVTRARDKTETIPAHSLEGRPLSEQTYVKGAAE